MGTPTSREHPSPRPVRRHDPALWLELRLGDETAALARLRADGAATGRQLVTIDYLLDRWHAERPCTWCVREQLLATGLVT